MKKIISIILLLCMVLSLSACGKVEVTMQEIYEASHLNGLLENHESVYVKSEESGVPYEECYVSKDYSYSCYFGEYFGLSSDYAFFVTEHAYYAYADDNYLRTVIISPDGLTENYRTEDYEVIMFAPDTAQETIQSITKQGDRITVVSGLPQESNDAADAAGLVSYTGEYVLDAKTRELISSKSVSGYNDGSVYDIVSEFSYDAELPELLKAFLAYDQQTDDLRTITVVSNPGTENEITQSVQVPKGLPISIESALYTDIFTMYADAACTEIFAFSEDHDADATIYVTWGE